LKERLGWDDTQIMTTFQSKFGPKEWLQPYTVGRGSRGQPKPATKDRRLRPGLFSRLHRNARRDQRRDQEALKTCGGESFTYPCLNDDDLAHIKALSNVIEENLQGGSTDHPAPFKPGSGNKRKRLLLQGAFLLSVCHLRWHSGIKKRRCKNHRPFLTRNFD